MILILVIIVVLITLLCFVNTKKTKDNQDISIDKGIIEKPESEDDEISITEFLRVERCISMYLDYINENNSSYYGVNENGEQIKVVDDSYVKNLIYDLLSNKYVDRNNISRSNIYNFIDNIETKQFYNILKIKKAINNNSNQYVVYGFLQDINNNFLEYKYFIVNLNDKGGTFSIEPIYKNYNSIDEIKLEDTRIESNSNNAIPNVSVTSESVCKQYLNMYKRIMLSNSEEAYELLDKQYREKRFGNITNFKKYVQDNKGELFQLSLNKFLVNVFEDDIEYVCKDKYNNIYIFKVKAPTEYTVKLDSYTITTNEFMQTYQSVNDQDKAIMNTNKWIEMLNNRDYMSAYKVLDETFRNNYFNSLEDFEQYIKKKYPLHYSTSYTKYKNENGLQILTVQLNDITKQSNSSNVINIIMKLKEGTDFVMSFEL